MGIGVVVVLLFPVSRDGSSSGGPGRGEGEAPAILCGPEAGAARVRWKE